MSRFGDKVDMRYDRSEVNDPERSFEAAIINACHSGQGGTGDIAILTAANRMQLMPFAQIATRIGGAITVTLVPITLSRLV
jgi:Na+/citrate or Na+/malate symporter